MEQKKIKNFKKIPKLYRSDYIQKLYKLYLIIY